LTTIKVGEKFIGNLWKVLTDPPLILNFTKTNLSHSILKKKIEYLLDFNQQINLVILRCLNISTEILFSSSYIENDGTINDFRDIIHPTSKPTETVKKMKYSQVFQESQDFIYNLSIFDLLFNQGPLGKQLLDS
jgi:hypothetical protein